MKMHLYHYAYRVLPGNSCGDGLPGFAEPIAAWADVELIKIEIAEAISKNRPEPITADQLHLVSLSYLGHQDVEGEHVTH